MQLQTPQGSPAWDDGREQRLLVSMLVAVVIVAAAVSLLRIPAIPAFMPLVELIVRIVQPQPVEVERPAATDAAEPAPPPDVPDESSEPLLPAANSAEASHDAPADVRERAAIDWPAARNEAVQAYLDRLERPASVNPAQDQMRRDAAGQYRPRTRELPRPIWENAEVDQLGRTVLRSGDCFKVLDDPNVGSRPVFEEFHQHMAICTYQKRLPKMLPWVAIIRDRYDYLTSQDYYLTGQPRTDYSRIDQEQENPSAE